jgi:DUF917 family protein
VVKDVKQRGVTGLISLPKHLGTVLAQQHNGFDQCSKHTKPYIVFGGQVQNRLALVSDMQKLGGDVRVNRAAHFRAPSVPVPERENDQVKLIY